jgi:outer membrane protein TolC
MVFSWKGALPSAASCWFICSIVFLTWLGSEKGPRYIYQRPTTLQRLVQESLENNLDLRIAAQRVLEAQAQVGITRSQHLPSLNGGAGYSALQIPSALAAKNRVGTNANSFFNGGGLSASAAWNLDFWGLYRRQTEAARAELADGSPQLTLQASS